MSQPQPRASGPAPVPPFAAMLRACALPMACAAPVIVLLLWATRGVPGGAAALLGVCIAVTFFAGGLAVMGRVTGADPFSALGAMGVMAGALVVYLGQVVFLGVVILLLSEADWLDGQAFGVSILAVALLWQLTQVLTFVRLRQPLYDVAPHRADPSVDGLQADPAEQRVDQPADQPADQGAGHPADQPAQRWLR